MYKIKKTRVRGKALWLYNNGASVIYRKGRVCLYDKEYNLIDSMNMSANYIDRVITSARPLERMRHIEPKWAIGLNDDNILMQWKHGIVCLNWNRREITKEKLSPRGRVLSVAEIKDIEEFKNGVVVGDYGGNNLREEVNIYRRDTDTLDWNVVYSFEPGVVRHIHGVVPDKENGCVYILTGDEDWESGIWRATNDFKKVEPMLIGSQQYRTCQLWTCNGRLYYATDAPSKKNHVYKVENGKAKALHRIRGTGIYGTKIDKGFLLSTTCEPDAKSRTKIEAFMTNKPGKGVEGRNVDVLYITPDGKMKTIRNYKHDGFPLRLMQYGTVAFTNFANNRILFTALDVKQHDMDIYEIVEE